MQESIKDTDYSSGYCQPGRGKSLADVEQQDMAVMREMKIKRLIIDGDCAGALNEVSGA